LKTYKEIKEDFKRIYAVGDVHGCATELEFMLNHLQNKANLEDTDLIIFIGDYIDRGPDSMQVIELLLNFKKSYPQSLFLRGNHEDMFLNYMGEEGGLGEAWLLNGGDKTLGSYKIDLELEGEKLKTEIPETHLSFLQDLERYIITKDYVFAHAGLNPIKDLKHQLDEDLFWIREAFIENMHYFKKTVVFGHTPYQDILLHLPYKIGIDTGLVFGNMLSCAELINGHIFQVKLGEKKVTTSTFSKLLD